MLLSNFMHGVAGMVVVLVLVGIGAAVYFASQGLTGVQAEACGHCSGQTEENMGQRLSYDAILQLAQNAGFDADAPTAAAIAVAESGGDPDAYNKESQAVGYHGRTDAEDGKGSYGLWQIYLFLHPEFAGQDLTDPETNANAAYRVFSDAKGFHPWSTFKDGTYQQYMS
jgi:lysozyme-like protein